ncbi:MAG: Rrf2 family transcriptional regulator [Burkholderiales bacterium]|nr:Rrf2 family transcriptional regulator [Burkholderiales bacterium]
MRITTKSRYALRMIVDLATRDPASYIALRDIAKNQDISKKYLEQIVPLLTQAGILKTTRGFQGGYQLAKTPEEITVADILLAAEGSFAPVACLNDSGESCQRSATCPTQYVWNGLEKVIENYLCSITVRDIVEREKSIPNAKCPEGF